MPKKHVKYQPDAFHQTFKEPLERLSTLGWAIIAGLLAVFVAAGVLLFMASRLATKEAAGWQRFSEALSDPDPDSAKHALLLEAVAEASPGTAARPVALLDAAGLLHQKAVSLPPAGEQQLKRDNTLKHAAELAEQFLKDYPDHEWAVPARERLALIQEDTGLYKEAAENFQLAARAAEKSPFAFLSGKLLYGQARCAYGLKDEQEALRLVNMALDKRREDRGTAWHQAAEAFRARMRAPPKNLLVAGVERDKEPESEKPARKGAGAKKPAGP